METVMGRIRERLAAGGFELEALFKACADRLEVIVTFLAMLELMHAREAWAVQSGQFGAIMVQAAAPPAEPEPTAELEDAGA